MQFHRSHAIFVGLKGANSMAIADRLPLYETLEKLRARPLVVYVTSTREGISGQMASDVIPELLDQLTDLPRDTPSVDLLIVSEGGDAKGGLAGDVPPLRERCQKVAVLVPQVAFSAATLLALGADEIVMHPNANLGPVDPQIHVTRRKKDSEQIEKVVFGYEDMVGFLDFLRNTAGLADQQHLKDLFMQFCQEVGTVPVGVAVRGSLLSLSMGEKLLRMHMKTEADAEKAKQIAAALNSNFFDHGYPVSRTEAREIGLKVAASNPDVELLMWKIWQDLEEELKMAHSFPPNSRVIARTTAAKPAVCVRSSSESAVRLPGAGVPANDRSVPSGEPACAWADPGCRL